VDVRVIQYLRPRHDGNGTGIDGNGTGKVADVGSLPSSTNYLDAKITQHCQKLFSTLNQSGESVPWEISGVTVYGTRNNDVVEGTDACEIVYVHDDAVLSDTPKDVGITCFSIVKVSKNRFCAGAVRMYNATRIGISC
jgi:hypothetical protein